MMDNDYPPKTYEIDTEGGYKENMEFAELPTSEHNQVNYNNYNPGAEFNYSSSLQNFGNSISLPYSQMASLQNKLYHENEVQNQNIYDNCSYNKYNFEKFNNISNNFDEENLMIELNNLKLENAKAKKEKEEIMKALNNEVQRNDHYKAEINILKKQCNKLYSSKSSDNSFNSKTNPNNPNNPFNQNVMNSNIKNKMNKNIYNNNSNANNNNISNISNNNSNNNIFAKSEKKVNKENKENKENKDQEFDFAELTLNLSKYKKEVEDCNNKINNLESKLKDTLKQKEDKVNENQELTKKCKDLQDTLNKANLLNKQYENDLSDNNNKLTEAANEKEKLINEKNKYIKIEEDYKKLLDEKEMLLKENLDLSKAKEALYQDIKKKDDNEEELKQQILTYEKKIQYLNENSKLLSSNMECLNEKNEELIKIISNFTMSNEKLDSENKIILDKLANLKNDTNEKLNDKQNLINALYEKTDNLEQLNVQLNDRNNELISNINKIKDKYKNLQSDYEGVKQENLYHIKNLKDTKEDNEKLSVSLQKSKSQIDINEQNYQEKIQKLTEENNKLTKNIMSKDIETLKLIKDKDKEIGILQYQIDNPQTKENFELYNPKFAVQSCIIASKNLVENAHNFYSEQYKNLFLEAVDKLTRELEVLLKTLNSESSSDAKLRQLTIQYEKTFKELVSYRQDNQKLFIFNNKLNEENITIKKMNSFINTLINRIINLYVNDIDLRHILQMYWESGVRYIYTIGEIDSLEKRINEYKTIFSLNQNETSRDINFNTLYNKNKQYEELKQLEKERENNLAQLEDIKKYQNDCEMKLNFVDTNFTQNKNMNNNIMNNNNVNIMNNNENI